MEQNYTKCERQEEITAGERKKTSILSLYRCIHLLVCHCQFYTINVIIRNGRKQL